MQRNSCEQEKLELNTAHFKFLISLFNTHRILFYIVFTILLLCTMVVMTIRKTIYNQSSILRPNKEKTMNNKCHKDPLQMC